MEAEEALRRGPFVRQIVVMLDQIGSRPSSSVIALVGPWGSGKTSTVNLVIAGLDQNTWAGAGRLLPWALSTPDAIVGELLGAIASSLPKDPKAASLLLSLSGGCSFGRCWMAVRCRREWQGKRWYPAAGRVAPWFLVARAADSVVR